MKAHPRRKSTNSRRVDDLRNGWHVNRNAVDMLLRYFGYPGLSKSPHPLNNENEEDDGTDDTNDA